jgi:cell division protein ZipA
MARHGSMFSGADLLPVLRKQGLHLGEMSIFHRHAEMDGSGQVMFSMANMVKPGTFNLATMENFSTPGVSFFLQLPNKLGNLPSFEKMLAAASAVKVGLDGEFKDENRSVFTRQTVEHCRQRIQDFELALLKRK